MSLHTTDDSMAVELCLSEHSLGLPVAFDLKLQRSLGLDLAATLADLLDDSIIRGSDRVMFGVSFAPTCRETLIKH